MGSFPLRLSLRLCSLRHAPSVLKFTQSTLRHLSRFMKRAVAGALASQPLAKVPKSVSNLTFDESKSVSSFVDCPVCGHSVPLATINFHIDSCMPPSTRPTYPTSSIEICDLLDGNEGDNTSVFPSPVAKSPASVPLSAPAPRSPPAPPQITPGNPFFKARSEIAADSRQLRPLAERMRPDTLDGIMGQCSALAPGSSLVSQFKTDKITSMILWGPPGCGKTTFAMLMSRKCHHFVPLSAVSATVKDVRDVMEKAKKSFAQVSVGNLSCDWERFNERSRGCSSRRASEQSCFWTKFTASIDCSKTRSCHTWRAAPSFSWARLRRTRRFRATQRSCRAAVWLYFPALTKQQ